MRIDVRAANDSDSGYIVSRFARLLRGPNGTSPVVLADSVLSSCTASVAYDTDSGALVGFSLRRRSVPVVTYVSDDFRHQGIGKKLRSYSHG